MINLSDIKLLESERMNDNANGGGRRTNREIVDGAMGNVFPKVSRSDKTAGRVNLRKFFPAVVTDNLDVYAGAMAVILEPPTNGRVHVVFFYTGSDYDTRTAAREWVESYVVAGPESRAMLYGRQIVGQQAVLIYQRTDEPLPEVGDVLCLSKETSTAIAYQQFVRISDIMSNEVRTFTDSGGDFERRVVQLKTGSRLRYEFRGPDTPQRISSAAREALVRVTTDADAARYYGIHGLAEAAPQNALTLRVDSIFTPIVPSTQRESALSLASINGAGGYIATAAAPIVDVLGRPFQAGGWAGRTYYTGRPIRPGSLRLLIDEVEHAADDGNGSLVRTSTGSTYPVISGSVVYDTGAITSSWDIGGATIAELRAQYMPAIDPSQPARTQEVEITLGNRGTVYSMVLNPPPAPGSAILDFPALGRWYRLRDDGNNQMAGSDPAHGVGTVDYVTGALVATLGALPDVGSSLLVSAGSNGDFEILAGATANAASALEQSATLTQLPIGAGSLEWSFVSGGATYTATADGSGVISGSGVVGTVHHSTGKVRVRYTGRVPDPGTSVVAAYSQDVPDDPGVPVVVTATIDWAAPGALSPLPVVSGSLIARVSLAGGAGNTVVSGTVEVTDDGAGHLVIKADQPLSTNRYGGAVWVKADTIIGTINYSTGALVVPTSLGAVTVKSARYQLAGAWSVFEQVVDILSTPGTCYFTSAAGDSTQAARTETFSLTAAPLELDLTATKANPVVPGSVMFTLNNSARFIDRNGVLYTAVDPTTGAGTACGTMEYAAGRARLTTGWPAGATSTTVAVQCCLTAFGNFTASDVFFRSAGSPLRPASMYVQAVALDGTLLSGVADENGNITGTKVSGEVVQAMGVTRVRFGEQVGPDWVPIEILPSTFRYSCVVLSSLPMDPDLLGLDPVRLPSDGRAAVYRAGDVVLIHHTDTEVLDNPVEAGETYSMGRTDLGALWLVDAEGERVSEDLYVADLEAGEVTMAADLDLTGVPLPLSAKHRIDELQQLTDVQITGELSLTAPLSRDFPLGTYVSTALRYGDLQASVPVLFDQATWTVWSDELIGSGTAAELNVIDHPIELLNSGAVTDRWRLNFLTGNPTSGVATFQIISESMGVIGTGNTGEDCGPVNPLTGKRFWLIRKEAFGLGWPAGAQLRFNTKAAAPSTWALRAVLPGATVAGDSFRMGLIGDIDDIDDEETT